MVYRKAVIGQFQHVSLERRGFGALVASTSGTFLGRMKEKLHKLGESGDEKLIHGHFLTLFSVSQ